ncbi:MAG: plasmid stabilization protein [Devosia nanyangense]|uniref:Plasmid stabilization protein n=1 Tax=Devosia nanyangense TaxID=1228055 RepID=A0A933NY80_9HYPH|nr:plasmid stabilization protein [Devosia nanyangense]
MKTIIFSKEATRDFDALPMDTREQIDRALDGYALHGRGDVRSLSGRPGYRLRTGRYRIIFDEDAQTILAIYIGKRETTTYRRN